MQWIVDFFVSIYETLSGVISFVVSAVVGLLDIIKMIPSLLTTVTEVVNGLPNVLSAFILSTITITVIFLLIGRGEGGD